ncbi:HNH endonuclease [bacterium]|nr:HNH endonuclease [candidate division CSSED10-310 bacterium]
MSNRPEIPAEIKRMLLIESGHRCAVCGEGCPLERAHIIPWNESKSHRLENLICLCANCHERADREKWGKKTLKTYKEKPWIFRRYGNNFHEDSFTEEIEIKTIELSITYRRKRGADTWHWSKSCSFWPSENYEERVSKPTDGELCNQCASKWSNSEKQQGFGELNDGDIIQEIGSERIYLLKAGIRYWVRNWDCLHEAGYDEVDVKRRTRDIINKLPLDSFEIHTKSQINSVLSKGHPNNW